MRISSLLAVLLAFAAAAAQAGELVVTKSTVPGLGPGTIIDGADKLTLRTGHRLSLIAPTGRVINLVGPYDGVPDASAGGPREEKLVTTIATLMTGHGRDASQLGATRDAAARRGRQVWAVEVGATGAQCVQQGQSPVLWRPGAADNRPVEISKAGSGKVRVDWPKNAALASWPRKVPVEDGASYVLAGSPITLHVVAAPAGNPVELAATLTEKGCEAQALAVLSTAE